MSGLDDLDPAAAFLAREHEQLGELEEEIGSLSGASSCCALRSFCFQKTFSSWFSLNGGHCWISGELSWSWLGLEESERSESQLCLPSHCICFRSSVANCSHPSSDKHLDVFAMIRMSVPLHCLACSTGASGDQGVEGETGETGPTWKELERFSAFASF